MEAKFLPNRLRVHVATPFGCIKSDLGACGHCGFASDQSGDKYKATRAGFY